MDRFFEDGSYGCKPGIDLIADVLAGKCRMEYTKARVGKGYLTAEENPKERKDVKDYVMDAQIAAITSPVNGECQVTLQINSKDVEEGFYATGILLYAKSPDGEDVPYTYLVLENEPEWIRPKTSDIGKLATFDLIVAVGEVDQVMAVIDTDSVMTRQATEKYLGDMVGMPDNFDPDAAYKPGDVCVHDGKAWRRTGSEGSGAWDESLWARVDLYEESYGETMVAQLKNPTGVAFFGNETTTVAFKRGSKTLNYTVTAEAIGNPDNVGDIIVSDKLTNGFKVRHTGSARNVLAKLYVRGGNVI